MSEGGSERRALHVTIHGRVQGVGFRDWVVRQAQALGLDGWVRNLRDGGVEALIAGDPARLDQMLEALRRGPSLAQVDAVDAAPAEPPPPGDGFHRRPTA